MAQLITDAINEPENIDEAMYVGNTYLIPKVKMAKEAKELRTITCLPNLYKLLSKTVTAIISEICEVNDIISENQMGTRKGCQGAKQQVLLNRALNKEHQNELSDIVD